MPSELKYLRNTAHALLLVRIAGSAYTGSDFKVGREMLERALEMDHTLKDENIDLMVNWLINYISGLNIGNPEDTLRQIMPSIPGEKAFAKNLERRLYGKY